MIPSSQEVAQCVGLWLAEGDNKTSYEVTFTNNCFELIELFHRTMTKIFGKEESFRPRLYSYGKASHLRKCLLNISSRNYTDKRARKPYYIYRFASVELTKKWKETVQNNKANKRNHVPILQGFFAGEGNIKSGNKNRVLRIAQKRRSVFFEQIFDHLNLTYNFRAAGRSYVFWSRETWDIFSRYDLASLHPDKKQKFNETYTKFKEYHYSKHHLFNNLPNQLNEPKSAKELSSIFSRSQARISEVLVELKKVNKVEDFRVRSKNYWIKKPHNTILISGVKAKYLNILKEAKRTYELARELKVTQTSSKKRLLELEKLGLVEQKNKLWYKKPTSKKIVILQ